MVTKGRIIRLYPKEKEKEFFNLCFRFNVRAWNMCHANYLAHIMAKKYGLTSGYRNDGKSITNNNEKLGVPQL